MADESRLEPEVATEEEVAGAQEAPAAAAQPADAPEPADEAPDPAADAAPEPDYLLIAQRTQADFDNFRKRMTREVSGAEARGKTKVVKELLPALDNLERAIAAAEAEETDEEHHMTKGIRLVQQELAGALERVGIEAFSPKGETFDPTQHEAMAQQPVEGAEAGTVVEVYQQGYRLSGAVIRPARVVVAA